MELVSKPKDLADDSPVIRIISQLVQAFNAGTSTDAVREEVTRILNSQEERAELIDGLLVANDVDRLPNYLRARSVIEQYLLGCASRSDLSPAEALAFLKIVQVEIEGISSRVRGGAVSGRRDVMGLIDKADFVTRVSEVELSKKFSNTTPQGREILRKVGYRLMKATKDA
jgi:hypothetical protein